MSRVEALSHLKSAENDNGSFLVRISETSDIMGFVLSGVCYFLTAIREFVTAHIGISKKVQFQTEVLNLVS